MSNLDLNQIATFVKVVECGSFTKAAELLKQPKSRISRRISALEKSLGLQLLYRTTRQMQLTDSGKDYYRQCAPLIQSLENASSSIITESEELTGTLRITAPEDMAKFILAPIIDEFQRRHPKIRFDMVLAGEYLDLVKESIDVAVRVGNLKDAAMKSKRLFGVNSILVATPAFLEKQMPLTHPSQLENIPCLSFRPSRQSQWKLYRDKQEVKVKIQGPVTANSPEFMYHFALLGRGVALIPDFLCEEALESGKLVHVLKGWTSDIIPVQLLTPSQKEIPAKTKAFMDFVWERLNQ